MVIVVSNMLLADSRRKKEIQLDEEIIVQITKFWNRYLKHVRRITLDQFCSREVTQCRTETL